MTNPTKDITINGTKYEISIPKERITDFPLLATVATGGSYNDLTDKPTIPSDISDLTDSQGKLQAATGSFSGDYNDLTNKPTIPSIEGLATESWVEGKGYLTSHQDISGKVDKVEGKELSTNDLTDSLKSNYDAAYTHSQSTHAPNDAQKNVQSDWNATEGDALILNKPTIPSLDGLETSEHASQTYLPKENGKGLFSGSYNDLSDKPTIPNINNLVTLDTELSITANKKFSGDSPNITITPTGGSIAGLCATIGYDGITVKNGGKYLKMECNETNFTNKFGYKFNIGNGVKYISFPDKTGTLATTDDVESIKNQLNNSNTSFIFYKDGQQIKLGKPTGLSIGTKLGMLYRNNEFYLFSSTAKCAVIDLSSLAVLRTFDMPVASHYGSNDWIDINNKIMASANDDYSNPCIYIINLSNESNITYTTISTASISSTYFNEGMQLICYDSENKIMYLSGYKKGDSNKSKIVVTKLDFSEIVSNNGTTFTLLDTFEIDGMHILDGAFYNGYLFMAVDSLISGKNPGGETYDASAVAVIDPEQKQIIKTYKIVIDGLAENTYPETLGCAIDIVRNRIYVVNLYNSCTIWALDFSPEVNLLRNDIEASLGNINTILTNILG